MTQERYYYEVVNVISLDREGTLSMMHRRCHSEAYDASTVDEVPLELYKLVWTHPDFTVGVHGFAELAFLLQAALGNPPCWLERHSGALVEFIARSERIGRPIGSALAATMFQKPFSVELRLPTSVEGCLEFLALDTTSMGTARVLEVRADFKSGTVRVEELERIQAPA